MKTPVEFPPPPPTLDYVRVLFAGEQRFRSYKIGFVCVVMFAMSAACGIVAAGPVRSPAPHGFRIAFGFAAAVTFAAAGFFLVGMITDRRVPFEITTAGIRNGGRRTVPWNKIVCLVAGGSPADPSIRLFYKTGRPGFARIHELLDTDPMSPAQYEALVQRLRAELLPSFPHLQLGGYESVRTLGS